MDMDRLCDKRWKRELQRRRLRKARSRYLGVKGNTMEGWDKKRVKERKAKERRRKIQTKKS